MEITWGEYKPRTRQITKKLTLEAGEQARVCVLGNLHQVWVHSFDKIVTDERGRVIEVHDTWPDGQPRVSPKTEYAGAYRCLGNVDVLNSSQSDPENCPACAANIENANAVHAPKPRYITKVLKYRTKPGTFNVAKPFAAELIAWNLTDKRADTLKSIYMEAEKQPSTVDLLLGPCENKSYQKYDIRAGSGEAAWLEHKDYIKELNEDSPMEDLASVAAKLPSHEEMRLKASEIVRAYNHAYGKGVSSADYDSLLGSDDDDEEEAPRPKKTQPAPEPADDTETDVADEAADEEDNTDELQALLASLGN